MQSFGFDTFYLTPIFQASSNHRYDTDDYLNVDPALGGNGAFTSLVNEMNHRGMRVILDGVFNHASSDSLYFNRYNRFPDVGACQSLSSPYRSWFHFNDNNVPCTSADYPGWDGTDSLPTFDHTQTAVQNFFYADPTNSVMAKWYAAGASGWRFDVAPDPNFPHSWWVNTRQSAKTYKSDGPLIGEIWPNASQWLAGDQLDSTMNYRFRRNVTGFARGQYGWTDNNDNGNDSIIPLTPSQFDTANRAIRDDYPPQATAAMLNLIDSHDTNRALYVLTETGDSGLTQAKQRLELAALFQFTYIGAPTVFYGDEAAINAPSRYSSSSGPVGDPYARAPYPWTDQPGDPTVYGPPDSGVIAFYTKLGHLRKQYPALSSGTFVTLLTGDTQQPGTAANTYAYARVGTNQTAIVALNNGSNTNTPSIPVGAYYADGTTLEDALSGNTYNVSGGNVSLTSAGAHGCSAAAISGEHRSDASDRKHFACACGQLVRMDQQLSRGREHFRQRYGGQRRKSDSLLGRQRGDQQQLRQFGEHERQRRRPAHGGSAGPRQRRKYQRPDQRSREHRFDPAGRKCDRSLEWRDILLQPGAGGRMPNDGCAIGCRGAGDCIDYGRQWPGVRHLYGNLLRGHGQSGQHRCARERDVHRERPEFPGWCDGAEERTHECDECGSSSSATTVPGRRLAPRSQR